MELMLQAYQQNAMKRMESMVNRTNEMMLQTGDAQLTRMNTAIKNLSACQIHGNQSKVRQTGRCRHQNKYKEPEC